MGLRDADLDAKPSGGGWSVRQIVHLVVDGDDINYMQGPSEFTITGTLKNYDATPFLPQIKVPTLYTVGEFDEANPKCVERFASITPGAQLIVFSGAAHITPWDARDKNVSIVAEFLRSVDSVSAPASNGPAGAKQL